MKYTLLRGLRFFIGFALMFSVGGVFAASSTDLSGFVGTVQTGVLEPVMSVIVAVAYLSGIGFVIAGLFKFKSHKDQPAQVPIGQPIFLLGVGTALLFAPSLITLTGTTLSLSSGGSLTYTAGGSIT